jgi:hypothetical protein
MNTAPHPASSYRILPLDMRGRHLTAGQLATILPVLAEAAFSLFGHGDHDVLQHGQRGRHVVIIGEGGVRARQSQGERWRFRDCHTLI